MTRSQSFTGQRKTSLWPIFLTLVLLTCTEEVEYSSSVELKGNNFFEQWTFYTGADPTNGFVRYVDRSEAEKLQLISVDKNDAVYLKVDSSSTAADGRPSVRLEGKEKFNPPLLLLLDVEHGPTGCGTWPAFWTLGPDPWPTYGEIDIIEAVNVQKTSASTLHTTNGCEQSAVDENDFLGTWAAGQTGENADNCYISDPDQYSNQGCSINGPDGSFGSSFNSKKGGIYAMEWTTSSIRVWFFQRSKIPSQLKSSSLNPDNWGTPLAYFKLGSNCSPSKFQNHKMILNIALCGDYAGQVFSQQCPNKGTCNDYVRDNPSAFKEAYWKILSLKIYSQGSSSENGDSSESGDNSKTSSKTNTAGNAGGNSNDVESDSPASRLRPFQFF